MIAIRVVKVIPPKGPYQSSSTRIRVPVELARANFSGVILDAKVLADLAVAITP